MDRTNMKPLHGPIKKKNAAKSNEVTIPLLCHQDNLNYGYSVHVQLHDRTEDVRPYGPHPDITRIDRPPSLTNIAPYTGGSCNRIAIQWLFGRWEGSVPYYVLPHHL